MVRRFLLSLLIVLVVLLALMPVLVCGLLVSELARDPLAGRIFSGVAIAVLAALLCDLLLLVGVLTVSHLHVLDEGAGEGAAGSGIDESAD